ncbi:MAG: Gfo/Idh/MocA family oxidoreductase [Planctomycetes bacterium]|nr:Gfo/Idh/MocA family oxidoreductase [Planctomycetota bacterium]
MTNPRSPLSRRDFVASASTAVAATTLLPSLSFGVQRPSGRLKVGVIGCGGRGTGAAADILAASPDVEIWALGDMFPDRVKGSLDGLKGLETDLASRVNVAPERQFTGFDAYKQVIASGVDIVICATAPHFRPMHLAAAIEAGKHAFIEKPVAVDPAGVRAVIAASKLAQQKNLSIVCGTQRRHEKSYLEALARIKDGAIGDPVAARCYWNQGGLWVKTQSQDMTDMEWQLRNWLYFTWLSGDHIVEQHVHNLDVMNWIIGANPVRCWAMGGREVRKAPEYGHIFDHFAVEYEYPNGVVGNSFCRQIEGCVNRVEEVVHGTKGTITTSPGRANITGPNAWKFAGQNNNPYRQEHVDFMAGIMSNKPLNQGIRIAESTLTAIMGRMAAYTGKAITWDQAMNSKLDLSPSSYTLGSIPAVEVAVPGKTPLI